MAKPSNPPTPSAAQNQGDATSARSEPSYHDPARPVPHPSTADDGRKLYWIGCDDQGPAYTYHLGGVTFQHRTDEVIRSKTGGLDKRNPRNGSVVPLDVKQVQAILADAHRRAVRPEGARRVLVECRRNGYVRRSNDYPVGAHVYMIPFDESGAYPPDELPPRLLARDGKDWTPPPVDPPPSVIEEARKAVVLRQVLQGDKAILQSLGLQELGKGIDRAASEAAATMAR